MASILTVEKTAVPGSETLSPDEFMALPIEHAELVRGRVIEQVPPTFDHGEIVLFIGSALLHFVRTHDLGRVTVEGSFRTGSDSVRAPDVAFLSNVDLEGENTQKYVNRPPTLAVEVISQNDTYQEVDAKADEFLAAGSAAVWIVNPRNQSVQVRLASAATVIYGLGQVVPGGDILPGFELPVARFFSPR